MGRCSESNEPHRVKWSGGSDSPIVLLDTRERQMPRLALTILTIVLLVAMPSAWAGLASKRQSRVAPARRSNRAFTSSRSTVQSIGRLFARSRQSGLNRASDLKIADIGCGTGAATRVLARELDAHVTAVDFLPELLAQLEDAAGRAGLADRITTLCASMESLPFAESELDAIWSEGAIYNMGFAAGITAWRRY